MKLINENPGEISVVMIGPQTNLALALKLDATLGAKIKDVIFIGGTFQQKGNTGLVTEFNIHADPEAAYIVLNSKIPAIKMIPAELCDETGESWAWCDKWVGGTGEVSKFFKAICGAYVKCMRHTTEDNPKAFILYDTVVIAVLMYPHIVLTKMNCFVDVELAGKYSRGLTVIDWQNRPTHKPNCTLVTKIDTVFYIKLLESIV